MYQCSFTTCYLYVPSQLGLIYTDTYVHIYRERETERDRETEIQRERREKRGDSESLKMCIRMVPHLATYMFPVNWGLTYTKTCRERERERERERRRERERERYIYREKT